MSSIVQELRDLSQLGRVCNERYFCEGLYRFTLEQALTPGEYALVESSPEGDISLYVWDFGVDEASGDNSGPEQSQRAKQ